ncbi:hypothetical protein [Pseudoalteromonas sp. bablab_jr010]|uniref:hypothetical protein n=1 Tax=Pseudoalteromonas sp. bablab_jr010 TaxID=2755063 RepID=UPI0018F5885A|nr:hypothetical protein [Pseudoalteromonas sp. bablab_jr010]
MKKETKVDLQALRFPVASLHLSKTLDDFLNSENEKLTIITIDLSIGRCIKQRIAHRSLPLVLESGFLQEPITSEHINSWCDAFDEEDYEDVSFRQHHVIVKS